MKRILLTVVTLLVATCLMAQNKTETINSVNVDLLLPIGKSTQGTYTIGNAVNILQLPLMAGIKCYFGNVFSIQTTSGVVVTNNGQGVNFIYSPSLNFNCGKVTVNTKFINTVIAGANNNIISIGLGITYKL